MSAKTDLERVIQAGLVFPRRQAKAAIAALIEARPLQEQTNTSMPSSHASFADRCRALGSSPLPSSSNKQDRWSEDRAGIIYVADNPCRWPSLLRGVGDDPKQDASYEAIWLKNDGEYATLSVPGLLHVNSVQIWAAAELAGLGLS